MKFRLPEKTKDLLFLLLVTLLAYWPVSFMVFSLKNDAINYFLAMRVNVSEAIQYNYFPAWSPYINMGYPLHADMQSGVWNPLVIILSFIRKYDIYWLHVETMLAVFLSGVSMYYLLKHFLFNRKIILLVSCAYMLSGYVTDAGQFINWIYAATILPFVFLAAIRCFTEFKLKDAFLLGFAHSLMLLCSYPADFILLSYLLIFFIAFSFIKNLKKHRSLTVSLKFGKQLLFASFSFIIICLPAIISYVPFFKFINRGSGVDLETALSNSLAPANLLSFITPWATQKGTAFQATDPLIRNCYIGIVLLIFFIYYFFQKRQKSFIEKFLAAAFFAFLLFSIGKPGGIRVFSFHWLPLMDTFRHPANAKLFFIFSGQVLAAFALDFYFKRKEPETRTLKKISYFFLFISAIFLIISFLKSNILSAINTEPTQPGVSISYSIKLIKDNLSFYDLLFLNFSLVIITLSIFIFFLRKNQLKHYLLWIGIIEMAIVTQGMLPLTYVRKSPPSQVQDILNKQPKGYPLPDITKSIKDYSTGGMEYFDIIGCLNPYNKKPGRSDYIISPANLSAQEKYWDYISFRNKINRYPLVYFADTIYSVKDSVSFINSTSEKRACLIEGNLSHIETDSFGNEKRSIVFRKFAPGTFKIEATNPKKGFFVLLQNNYPNWKVYINGVKQTIVNTNLSFMGVVTPAGNSTIEFKYESGYLKLLLLISLAFTITGFTFFYLKKLE